VEIGVEASFNLSYTRLNPETARVFRCLAVFRGAFDATAEESVCEDAGHKRLSELVRRSLALYEEKTGRYRLHDLARLFASSRLSEAERGEYRRQHAAYYRTVLAAADIFYLKGGDGVRGGLALFDREWANIEAGQAWAASASAGGNEAAARLCIEYPGAGAHVLELRQHPRERIQWLEEMLAAAWRSRRRDAEGKALGNLGLAYAALGETGRAIESFEQALVVAREIGDRSGEGATLGNLGNAYADLGETRRAVEFFERALVIAREISDRRGEGAALGNLGNAYAALGETGRAIESFEQTLVIAREIGDRRGEGATLGNLGIAYVALGEPRRAVESFEQVLVIAREIGDRRSEGAALGNLGIGYADLGEPRRAVEFFEQALVIAREIGDRRGESANLGNLGLAYTDLGETGRAIELYEQHLAITRETGDRRGEGNALANAALALDKLGDRAQAIACAEAAFKIYEQIEDPNATKVLAHLKAWLGEGAAKNERQNLVSKIKRYMFRR
jgi:tetratricopeptide (TPR) repeat protein